MQLCILNMIFLKNSFIVKTAQNGQVACDMFVKSTQNEDSGKSEEDNGPFDLIVLDLTMPVMDGYTACQYIN